ncbi:MAG: hypothetical protein IJO48_01665 [Clostridia bacterium]|nr:hypothetical protein [Clostridia bacterium]
MRFLKSAVSYQITSFAVLPERRFVCLPRSLTAASLALPFGVMAKSYSVRTAIQFLWLAIPHIVYYNKLNYSIRKNITERGLTKMKNSATVSQSRVPLPASFVNTF